MSKNRYEIIECPHCGGVIKKELPTLRQQEAYQKVYIDGASREQAAWLMDISLSALARLLLRLEKIKPGLFVPKNSHIKRKKAFSYIDNRDSQPKRKF